MSDKLPTVIPRDLAKIVPWVFNQVVLQQSQRLNITGSRGLRTTVEEEFRDFKFASREELRSPTPLHSATGRSISDNASLSCASFMMASPPSLLRPRQ
jgi:hypothetical protein